MKKSKFLFALCCFAITGCNGGGESPSSPEVIKEDFEFISIVNEDYCTVRVKDLEGSDIVIPESHDGREVRIFEIIGETDYSQYKTLTLPKTVKKVVVSTNKPITTLNLDSINYLGDVNDWLDMDRSQATIAAFTNQTLLNGKTLTSVNIDRDLSTHAFFNFKDLTSVTLGENVHTIEAQAFAKTSIEELVIPNTVTTLKNYSLAYISSLEKLSLPLTAIPYYNDPNYDQIHSQLGFVLGTNGIVTTEDTIPKYLNFTNGKSFNGLMIRDQFFLEHISFSNELEEIPQGAFYQVSNLKDLTIPSSVNKIAYSIVDRFNENLENIFYLGTKTQWSSINKNPDWAGSTYSHCPVSVVHCSDGDVDIW